MAPSVADAANKAPLDWTIRTARRARPAVARYRAEVTWLFLACAANEPTAVLVDEDGDGVVAGVDCDDHQGEVTLPQAWYADADGDGYGDPEAPTATACAPPEGAVGDARDCDDEAAAVNPGAQEVCGGRDEDCDGDRDDEDDDVTGTTTWYADEDGDGVGGEALGMSCTGDGVTIGGDCDDADARRSSDCDACAHIGVDTLADVALLGVSDVLVDDVCFAYLSTVLYYDYVQLIHPSGVEVARFEAWDVVTDLPAMALDPDDGDLWVLGVTANGNAPMVGRLEGDTIEKVAEGVATVGSSWIGVYMNRNAQSIASDGTCLWAPNFAGNGTVVCVTEDGAQSTLATLPARVESVAISPAGVLHASAGATIYALDERGAAAEAWTFDHTVLDFAFGDDGGVYVETAGDRVFHAGQDGTTTFAEVRYDGKLVVTRDGWLLRVMPYWDGGVADIASLWEEWPL